MWAHLDLVYVFRSHLMMFVLDIYSLLHLVFRTITGELHDEVAPRPAGLGFLLFWLNFVCFVPEIK